MTMASFTITVSMAMLMEMSTDAPCNVMIDWPSESTCLLPLHPQRGTAGCLTNSGSASSSAVVMFNVAMRVSKASSVGANTVRESPSANAPSKPACKTAASSDSWIGLCYNNVHQIQIQWPHLHMRNLH